MSDQADHPKRNTTIERSFYPPGSDLPCSTKVLDHVFFEECVTRNRNPNESIYRPPTLLAYSIVSSSAASGQQSNWAVKEIGQLAAVKWLFFS